jgi:GTP-binding protein
MVGRSNVGKSTLINALVKQTIARTSAAPGKTRLANYYLVDDAFYFVDLPGYGYARGGQDAAEEFKALTAQYFDLSGSGRRVAGVLHLIDSRHPELAPDLDAHRWVAGTGFPIAVVATKLDKLKQSGRARALQVLDSQYDTQIVTTSALDGTGLKDLWKLLRSWVGRT